MNHHPTWQQTSDRPQRKSWSHLNRSGSSPTSTIGQPRQSARRSTRWTKILICCHSLAEWLESQHQNFPQITAERLRDRLLFDQVAVLLKTDEGLDLAGCVGWQPIGVGPVGRYDQSILTELGGNGARLIGPADRRRLLKAGLLGNEAKTIIVAPLKHENVAFGVLLVGHKKPDSKAPPQRNGSVDGIGSFARSVAPDLHAWLLLHRLREQLASRDNAQEQTTRLAESGQPSAAESPSGKAESPSAVAESPEVCETGIAVCGSGTAISLACVSCCTGTNICGVPAGICGIQAAFPP